MINGFYDSVAAQTYLKTPLPLENTPLLNTTQIDNSVYGGVINLNKKDSYNNDQSSDVPITNLKKNSNVLMPTTTLNLNITPFIINKKRKSLTTNAEETYNCNQSEGKINEIDCIIYNQSNSINKLNVIFILKIFLLLI